MRLQDLVLLEIDGSPFTDSLKALGYSLSGVELGSGSKDKDARPGKAGAQKNKATLTDIAKKIRTNLEVKDLIQNSILLPIPKPVTDQALKKTFDEAGVQLADFINLILENMKTITEYFQYGVENEQELLDFAKAKGAVSREAMLDELQKNLPTFINSNRTLIAKMVQDHKNALTDALIDPMEAINYGQTLSTALAKAATTAVKATDSAAQMKAVLDEISIVFAINRVVQINCEHLSRLGS
jgi:hypothetical protein